MTYPPSAPFDVDARVKEYLASDPTAEAAVIDEILDAYSEGDREGALRLVGRLQEVRRARAAQGADPFWSKANMERLRRARADWERGVNFAEHDLVEA